MEKVLPAYLSVVVAAIVAVVAFLQYRTAKQQWRTAHNRAVLDQFERRYAVYAAAREVVGSIVGSGRATIENFVKVAEAAERAKFLFGDDVKKYLDRLVANISELSSLDTELGASEGEERKLNIAAQRRLKDEIEKFRMEGTELFARYIKFADKIADA